MKVFIIALLILDLSSTYLIEMRSTAFKCSLIPANCKLFLKLLINLLN